MNNDLRNVVGVLVQNAAEYSAQHQTHFDAMMQTIVAMLEAAKAQERELRAVTAERDALRARLN